MDRLNRRYQVSKKGAVVITSLLKRMIQSGSLKIKWFVDNCTKCRHIFQQ